MHDCSLMLACPEASDQLVLLFHGVGSSAQAIPPFPQAIQHWQGVTDIGPDRTVLVGFSQGAIMSLESTQASLEIAGAAHTVISLAGRFAIPVRRVPADVRLYLIHGEQDGVVQTKWSVDAASQWGALGGAVTLDLVPGLGHGIDPRALRHVVDHLPQA